MATPSSALKIEMMKGKKMAPINFDGIASKAEATIKQQTEEATKRRHAEEAERNGKIEAAIKLLELYVCPRLEEAKGAFAKRGIASKIDKQFDVFNRAVLVWPSVSLQCAAPARSDGYVGCAAPIFFKAVNDRIHAGAGQNSFDREAKHEIGAANYPDVEPLVEKALARAVEEYFAMMQRPPTQR